MAGEEFMRTVFGLEKPGQVAVAFNAPKTFAYVVQLTEFSPAYEVRKSLFEVDDFRKYAAVAAEDQRQMERAWLKEIETSAGFEWTPGHNPEQTVGLGQPSGRGGPVEPDQSGEDGGLRLQRIVPSLGRWGDVTCSVPKSTLGASLAPWAASKYTASAENPRLPATMLAGNCRTAVL